MTSGHPPNESLEATMAALRQVEGKIMKDEVKTKLGCICLGLTVVSLGS